MSYTVPAIFKHVSSHLYELLCLLSPTVRSPNESFSNFDLLSCIFENQADEQEKPLLIDASNTLRFVTSGSARSTVRKLIAGLKAEGLKPGDCVCLHSFNDIYYTLLYLAIIGAGGIFTGSNPGYTSLELNHHITTSHAKYIIGEPNFLNTILETAKECNIAKSKIFMFDAVDKASYGGLRSWDSLLQHGEEDWIHFDDAQKQRNTVASLGFTSGSTGLPKAAMIPHSYAVSQTSALQSRGKPYKVVRLLCLPAFHAFPQPLITGCVFRERQPVYLMRRFDIAQFLSSIERFSVTETAMVPAMIVALLKSPLTYEDNLQSLRNIWTAGSPLRRSIQTKFQGLLSSEAKISQVWGMTETGWASAMFWPEGDDTGSVGRPLPGVSIKVVDNNGLTIHEDAKEGEMYVKSPSMMLGYLDNPDATASTIQACGWLKTGDIGYCREGKYYIVGRKKEMIKVRSWQVAPAEVEAVLLTHPKVLGAAVIGVQDADQTGELARAYIVRKLVGSWAEHEENDLAEELKSLVAQKLARYKHLDGGVIFVNEIPRNAMGKTVKGKLIALHANPSQPSA